MSPPLPSPPFVDIPGIANFRDIGNGTTARRGVVFRSADPSKATPSGLEKMSKDLGIKAIFDLRSAPEIKRDGPEWADVEVATSDVFAPYGMRREWTPVFPEQDYSPEAVAVRYREYGRAGGEGFVAAYREILKAAPPAYTKVFRYLAGQHQQSSPPGACLVHCTAGKDRTGVLVALILMLVGTSKEEIAEEYSLTDLGLAELKPIFIERLMRHPALEGNRESGVNMVSSRKESMLATVDMIEKEFGGAEKYMKEHCNLTEDEVLRLRKNLTQT